MLCYPCVRVTLGITGILSDCFVFGFASTFTAGGHRGPRGAVANEDLLWGPCKRTCQTGVVLLLIATRFSCFEPCWPPTLQ